MLDLTSVFFLLMKFVNEAYKGAISPSKYFFSKLEHFISQILGEPSGLDMSVTEDEATDQMPSSKVWCLASMHGQVVTGCGDGRIEVWEAETGELRYHYSISQAGVTGLCVVANK